MTPNPNSPIFIKHDVPENACDSSKKLSWYYFQLRDELMQNRWLGISASDITLTYNTYDGRTEVEVVFRDDNNHVHHFTMQLVPDNGFGDAGEDDFRLIYLFDGTFDENALSIRSFAEYLFSYLEIEGLELTLIDCGKGLSIPSSVKYAYEDFCKLIDVTLSRLKPLVWFYTKEAVIKSLDEVYYYLVGVKSRLQLESCRGRWQDVQPECFTLEKYGQEGETSLWIVYVVDNVWKLTLAVDAAQCDDYFDYFCTFNCYLDVNLSDKAKKKLDRLFADFLTTLKSAKGNTYVGCGSRADHSISIQYFHIDDTFDIFCNMLDEIVPALQSFNFQLPLQPVNLTGKIKAVKEQMETVFNTAFEVVTEEVQINKNLENGHFCFVP